MTQCVFWTHFALCSHSNHLPSSGFPGFYPTCHHASPRTPKPSHTHIHTSSPSQVTRPHHTFTHIDPMPGGWQPLTASEQAGGSFPEGGPRPFPRLLQAGLLASRLLARPSACTKFWQPWPCSGIVFCKSMHSRSVASQVTLTQVFLAIVSAVRHALSFRFSSRVSSSSSRNIWR